VGIFDGIRKLLAGGQKEAPVPMSPLSWRMEVPGWTTRDLLRLYTQNHWVYAVVSKIAQAVSAVPWALYAENSDGSTVEVSDGPIYALLRQPNKYMPWQEFVELSQIILELTGEVFWVLTLNRMGEPVEMWPVAPDRMSVVADPDEFIAGYVYRYGTEKIPLDVDEVIHVKYPNPSDPYRGVSPIKAAMTLIQNDVYAQEYTKSFFYNSAMPSGILKAPRNLTPEEFRRLKEQWNAAHQGVSKAHKIAVLENGLEFQPISYSLRELQLVDVRKQNRDDILATFGVHASILGISENVNRANAEAAEYTFAKRIVEPRLAKLAGKINGELLPKFRAGVPLRFVFQHDIPEDTDTILRKIEAGVKLGVMTVNEARNLLGLDDIKGGDVVLQPMNLIPSPVSYEADDSPDVAEITEPAEEEPQESSENGKSGGMIPAEGKEAVSVQNRAPKPSSIRADLRAIIWKRFVREQRKHEEKFKRALRPVWRKFQAEVERVISQGLGLDAVDLDPIVLAFQDAAKEQLKETFAYFARQGKADAKAMMAAVQKVEDWSGEMDDFVDMTLPHIVEWLETYPFKFAQQVSQTTIEMLRKELHEAFVNGEDLKQIMERVANVFRVSAEGYRAERIARTETIRAANKGALEGYRQAGVRKKEWITALDERTREWHAEADGQIVPIDAPFVVGGEELMYPGDPAGSPGNTINCRCTVAPVID